MPDYPEMYRILFRSQSRAIAILQAAQQQTEELFISSPPSVIFLGSGDKLENKSDETT